MADYSGIKGFNIRSFATDPYTSVAGAGTWAAGNALNTARSRIAGCGCRNIWSSDRWGKMEVQLLRTLKNMMGLLGLK